MLAAGTAPSDVTCLPAPKHLQTHMHDHAQVPRLLQQPLLNAAHETDDGFTLHRVVDDDRCDDRVVDETAKYIRTEQDNVPSLPSGEQ